MFHLLMISNKRAARFAIGSRSNRERFFSPLAALHRRASSVERFLILFGALAGSWFTFFDVYPPSDRFAFFTTRPETWALLFFSLAVAHLAALWANSNFLRRFSCLYHSVVWSGWVCLAYTAIRPTMATPLAFGLASMALYEAIRLRVSKNASR